MHGKGNGTTDFSAFVKRQQTGLEEGGPEFWAKQREQWLKHLEELYEQTKSFLSEYINRGEITVDTRNIPLNEENIGAYTAPQLVLKIGRQEITLTPVGTLLVAAKGRVDIEGPAGRARLVLVDRDASGPKIKVAVSIGGKPQKPGLEASPKEITWKWKLATSPPNIQYIDLTQQSLFNVLMEVANG